MAKQTSRVKEILVSALSLALIAGVTTAALAITNDLTKDIIDEKQNAEAYAARAKVMTADSFEKLTFTENGVEHTYYEGYVGGKVVGYVFTAEASGKSSGLAVMTGIATDGTITGVEITANNETASYFKLVQDSGFFDRFDKKSIADGFELGKNIDGITGATLTSKGVVSGVNKSVKYYETYVKGAQ